MKNPYLILKLNPNANKEEIVNAYITESKKLKSNPSLDFEEARNKQFQINWAYNMLINPETRRVLDRKMKYKIAQEQSAKVLIAPTQETADYYQEEKEQRAEELIKPVQETTEYTQDEEILKLIKKTNEIFERTSEKIRNHTFRVNPYDYFIEQELRAKAKKCIITGLACVGCGGFWTLLSYSLSTSAGVSVYYVWSGAIFYGIWKFIQGLYYYSKL